MAPNGLDVNDGIGCSDIVFLLKLNISLHTQ